MLETSTAYQTNTATFDTPPVNQDEEIAAFLQNREQEVVDFLGRQGIIDAYAKGQDTFEAIESATTRQEKVAAFNASPLNEFRTHMETVGSEFSPEERALLDAVNKKLAGNKVIETLLLGEGVGAKKGLLLEAIEQQLDSKSVGHVISDEIFHYRSVYELAREFFPGNVVLQITALVHDSHKYDANGRRQLGLHELASTASAEALTRESLQLLVEKNLIKLLPEEIEVVAKAVARATYTHGIDEFPAKMSAGSPAEGSDFLYWLWAELYPHPGASSIPTNFAEKPDTLSEANAGANLADILVGSDTASFKKYNMGYPTSLLASKTLSMYVEQHILASFTKNFESAAYFYYAEHVQEGTETNSVVKKINMFADRATVVKLLLDSDGTFTSTITPHLEAFIQRHPELVQLAEEAKVAYKAIRPAYEPFENTETALGYIKREMEVLVASQQKLEATFPPNKDMWFLEKKWAKYSDQQMELESLVRQYDDLLTVRAERLQVVDAARHAFDLAFARVIDGVIAGYTTQDVLPV